MEASGKLARRSESTPPTDDSCETLHQAAATGIPTFELLDNASNKHARIKDDKQATESEEKAKQPVQEDAYTTTPKLFTHKTEPTAVPAHEKPATQRHSTQTNVIPDERNASILPIKKNQLYNTSEIIARLNEYPMLRIRREGKYYLSMKDVVVEKHEKLKPRNRRGQVIPIIREEVLGPVESVFKRFCEDILCISRAKTLPLSSQGERHLIWVGRMKAKHIIKFLKGNGCYIVNRFPGDVFLKDKQVMGVTLRKYMLERRNHCLLKCGAPKDNPLDDEESEPEEGVTHRICQHMVQSMRTDEEGCEEIDCYNHGKRVCKHLDIFIPEVQSFCLYNALQDFSNRLEDDLKGQLFICKPSYLYKGLGFRFFHRGAEFQEFYHMTVGKETSRHDYLVQRVIKDPYLYDNRKVDIRAFMLLVTLRHRRVVAFVNPGFCRVASAEYEPFTGEEEQDDDDEDVKKTPRQVRQREAERIEAYMEMLVCPYQTREERADRAKRMAQNRLFTDDEDRSKELDEVFRSESVLEQIKGQIRHIGKCLASGIENKIWDAYGCYQIFGMDLCVDENYKVWLLEVNSHAMSEVDMLSPTQRIVVPAMLMEALGLVVECMYKSTHGLRLRKSPLDEFKETGFLFGKNFSMVFSTLTKRRTNYIHPRPSRPRVMPFHERVEKVDHLIRRAVARKQACDNLKRRIVSDKLRLKRRRSEKDEEES